MNRAPIVAIALTSAVLACAVQARPPGPPGAPPGGGRYAAPPGYWAGGYRPVYPAWRAGYWGPRGAYWGPRAGIYIGGPGYWGAWPYGWGAAYTVPYAWPYAAPYAWPTAVVTPAPQIIVQPSAAEPSAASYWYYCTEPAGYYPYVRQCSQPWMKVVPQVPGSRDGPPQLAP
ncbi:MAG TPA: hypothetical protein PKB14_12300 [Rubrivivax sp.]|nr:hypothetical protein [Rubrivivax sp.]